MFHAIYSKIIHHFDRQQIFISNNCYSSNAFKKKISKYKKIFLVTGKSSYEKSGAKKLISNSFNNSSIVKFNEFDVNPDISQLKLGYEIALKFQPDAVVAIGGGSVIDAAKVIHTMHSYKLSDKKIFNLNDSELPTNKNAIPIIAIPTTAGTGSESTHFAVLYDGEKKFSIAISQMLPNIVYLDSNLCLSNSPYQNACSGFDALAQAIESYWSKNSNFISRFFAMHSIRLILSNFDKAVTDNNGNKESLLRMLRASNYAGKAINITKTTGPHAISYGITKRIGLPHGHAVALTLGAFFMLHNRIFDQHKVGLKRFKEIDKFICAKTKKQSSTFLYDLMYKFNMEYDVNKLSLDEQMVDELIKGINLERLSNHPIEINNDQLREIFSLIPRKILENEKIS